MLVQLGIVSSYLDCSSVQSVARLILVPVPVVSYCWHLPLYSIVLLCSNIVHLYPKPSAAISILGWHLHVLIDVDSPLCALIQ